MDHRTPNYTDSRGSITDIIQKDIDSVTHITFTEGSVRGNHFHKKTTQYDYVLKGELMVTSGDETWIVTTGDIIKHKRNHPHAYKALADSEILSMTKGPRRGECYENDTFRLDIPLL